MELLLGSSVVEDSIDSAPTRLEERVIRYAADQFASNLARVIKVRAATEGLSINSLLLKILR
jgi:hypothetical protein